METKQGGALRASAVRTQALSGPLRPSPRDEEGVKSRASHVPITQGATSLLQLPMPSLLGASNPVTAKPPRPNTSWPSPLPHSIRLNKPPGGREAGLPSGPKQALERGYQSLGPLAHSGGSAGALESDGVCHLCSTKSWKHREAGGHDSPSSLQP